MNAPTINVAPTGIVHSTDSMYMDITVQSNSAGYYYIILRCNSTTLKLVFYTVNNHIRYSWRELILDQLAKNLLYTTASSNNAVLNIVDPINTITLSIQEPSEANDNLICTFKVFRMSEPDNQTTLTPAAGTRRLMLDGNNVIYREAMSTIPFSKLQSLTGSTFGYNNFFPVFSKYNKGVNRVAQSTTTPTTTSIKLMPVAVARYQLSVFCSLYQGTPYPANTDSIMRLYDNQLNHLEDISLHIFDNGVATSSRKNEFIDITNTNAAFCEIELVDGSMTLSQLYFAEVLSVQSMFDATFDNSFAGSSQPLNYTANPLAAIYAASYNGIGYSINMNTIESIIGQQTLICDGVKTYEIKSVETCENLIWLSWLNSYGVYQFIPMTGTVSLTEDADKDIDFNQYDTTTNRYLPTTHRKDYVQTVDINSGFEPDMVAIRSLVESEYVYIHNSDFTLSSRCTIACDNLSRVYNPTEPESVKLTATLITNNSFD